MDRGSDTTHVGRVEFSEFVLKMYPHIEISPFMLDIFERMVRGEQVIVNWPRMCGKRQIQKMYKEIHEGWLNE